MYSITGNEVRIRDMEPNQDTRDETTNQSKIHGEEDDRDLITRQKTNHMDQGTDRGRRHTSDNQEKEVDMGRTRNEEDGQQVDYEDHSLATKGGQKKQGQTKDQMERRDR